MKKLFTLWLLIGLACLSFAQGVFQKSFLGNPSSWTNCMQQTADSGYIMVGSVKVYSAGQTDLYLVKTDSLGNVQWNHAFGGTDFDEGYSVIQTSDGGYLAAGESKSFGNVIYVVKTDGAGNLLWSKTYDSGWIYSVKETFDGNYIMAGYGSGSVLLIKSDTNGNILWEKRYGGTGFDIGSFVEQTADSGFAVCGYTDSFGAGSNDLYLIKTDTAGNVQWSKTYGGADDDRSYCVHQMRDKGYILSGSTLSYGMGAKDFFIIKTDIAGNIVWSKTYGMAGADEGCYIIETGNQNYLVVGANTHTQNPYSMTVLMLDASGNIIWKKGYAGSFLETWGLTAWQTNDGGYAIGGYTEIPGDPEGSFYLIKTDATGYGGCDFFTDVQVTTPDPLVSSPATLTTPGGNIATPATIVHAGGMSRNICVGTGIHDNNNMQPHVVALFPNPFHSASTLHLNNDFEKAEIKIYNVLGEEVKRQKITAQIAVINRDGMADGIYFFRVINEAGESVSGKMVIE